MPTKLTFVLIALAIAASCGPSGRDTGDDQIPVGHIELSPPDLTVTIVDGQPLVQSYIATLVEEDGSRIEITDRVELSLENPGFGVWSGTLLTINGAGAGPTRVLARAGDAEGETGLVVYVKNRRYDGAGPATAPGLFDAATETPLAAPWIVYPADKVMLPPNLGELDVHWTDQHGNNLFAIMLHTKYLDTIIYKQGSGSAFTIVTPAEWAALAATGQQVTLTVAGLDTSNPTLKATSRAQTIDATNESVFGGMYYFTTQPNPGVFRYDMATPNVPPSSFFGAGQQPTQCIGCHTLSKDGTKMALTLDSGNGRGTIVDVATNQVLVPYNSDPQYWNFATFTPDSSKLITVYHGEMVLRATAGGAVLAPVPADPVRFATQPELSADGKHLAYVEATYEFHDFDALDGAIMTMTFDDTTNTFGPVVRLVPDAMGASNYYPSWSPDGEWILFTRASGNSYTNQTSQIWVVKADGTQPPIKLEIADKGVNLMNSWARWAPFKLSHGSQFTPMYYLTFSTIRPFGLRPTTGTQIWMAPFFPDRAALGQDPSGPAFRLPFQRSDTSNHIAQWTQAIVIQ